MVVLMLAFAAVPVQANYASVTGPMTLGIGSTAEFTLEVDSGVTATYTASLRDSRNQSVGQVDSSYGQLNGSKTVNVTMPSQPGTYHLWVVFSFADNTVRYKDWIINVVEPYVFEAVVVNDGQMAMNGVTVSFLVNGNLVGSKIVNVSASSSTSVNYTWVSAPLSNGAHTLEVRLDSEDQFVNLYTGGKSHTVTFYVGQQDYGGTNWIMGIMLVIIMLGLVWVYRKPVRNLGRPRGRKKR